MKVLFIYKYEYVEPLGLMTISAFLKKKGHQVYFIDLRLSKNYLQEIQEIGPDIIAYSVTTGMHTFYQKLNLNLKKRLKFFSIFGGPHCTFFPEFIEEEGVDAICKGEGEYATAELLENLEKKKDIKHIQNIDVKINGKIYKNPLRDLICNLDEIPYPDRELINRYKQYRNFHRRHIITGRGCPYNCTYCFNHSYNKLYQGKGNIIRKRTVPNVINELVQTKNKFHPRRFHFVDDTFILNKEWTIDFCHEYKEKIKLPFICNIRVNIIDEEIIRSLKEAGCITIVFAIESGDEVIRNKILKRNISRNQILQIAKLCHKYGLHIFTQNMVGLPDETLDSVWETIDLNIKCKPSYSWVSIFQPYPRTDLSEYSIKKGYYDGDVNSLKGDYYYQSPMKIKDIDKIIRLHHLFPLVVDFPFLRPIVKRLIQYDLNKIFSLIWNLHRGYNYFFKVRWIDFSEMFGL